MTNDSSANLALVLGGGGLSGIGWLTGVLAALEAKGLDLASRADQVVGTSAGSAVAAQVLQEGALRRYATTTRPDLLNDELTPRMPLDVFFESVTKVLESGKPAAGMLTDLIDFSVAHRTIDPGARAAVIRARLPRPEWPDAGLAVVALNRSGRVVLTRESGVPLATAVEASCAVPGIWPVVRIDGADHIDGGMFTTTNAVLARDHRRIVVVKPMREPVPGLDPEEAETLERAFVIEPGEHANRLFPADPFDPSGRASAALAGYLEGLELADDVARYLGAG
ncbi:patatin-like phospholipase family protein [Amycolatopsis sp. NPDC059021]|uniref:patatin-like phospholipase family protein n=1 Tax=Amycolatopsis sp. NPDC059021 TaxID=3346704 RepID=UPI00366F29A5